MKIETKRLVIDNLKASDKENYFINISNDKEVLKTFMCSYESDLDSFDFKRYVNREDVFAIRKKDTLDLIGIFVETKIGKEKDALEIGYGLGSRYWGNGYMTEVVKNMLLYYKNETDYNIIYASYFPENVASKRVMEKCGMVYSHKNENELTYLGKKRDLIYYKLEFKRFCD